MIDGREVTGWFTEDFTLAEIKTLRAREAGLASRNHIVRRPLRGADARRGARPGAAEERRDRAANRRLPRDQAPDPTCGTIGHRLDGSGWSRRSNRSGTTGGMRRLPAVVRERHLQAAAADEPTCRITSSSNDAERRPGTSRRRRPQDLARTSPPRRGSPPSPARRRDRASKRLIVHIEADGALGGDVAGGGRAPPRGSGPSMDLPQRSAVPHRGVRRRPGPRVRAFFRLGGVAAVSATSPATRRARGGG